MVEHLLALVNKHFYRGLRFHWVQPGLIQVGDPQSRDMTKRNTWGTGGSGNPVGVAEISKHPFVRGAVGLAPRPDADPKTADSQFFIAKAASPMLNGKDAYIGHVTKGMNVVDKIELADILKDIRLKDGGSQ